MEEPHNAVTTALDMIQGITEQTEEYFIIAAVFYMTGVCHCAQEYALWDSGQNSHKRDKKRDL